MGLEGFELFSDSDDGRPGDLEAVMALIQMQIDEHGMDPKNGILILHDLINPGHSDTSHDVRQTWVGAMYAFGFKKEICEQFVALYVNEMPWGVGFSIAVLPEFEFYALSTEAQQAVVKALGVVLESGGLIVEHVIEDNTLKIIRPKDDDEDEDEQVTTMTIDDLVGRFRQQIDEELPKILDDDEGRKWFP